MPTISYRILGRTRMLLECNFSIFEATNQQGLEDWKGQNVHRQVERHPWMYIPTRRFLRGDPPRDE